MSNTGDQSAESMDKDLSGRQFGDYRLLRRLGRGAMAEVYLAEQCSLHRQVAFKVLKSELAKDETYIKRFQREAQAAAALVHANIVQIHEVGRIDGVYFIAQEYVQGLNLRQWLTRNGTPDLRLALIIMRQVAAALTKAAEQGIVHRDVKPENIMITRSGEVKVADFGLARVTGIDEGLNLTQVGMTMGTPLYMSPEQVEGHPLDPRSDIYSFGITCYHMLAGAPPFGGETALAVAVQHLKKSAEPLENIRTDLPPAICRVVHKMLAKAPERRYQSPRELLKELHKLQLEYLDENWPEDLPGLETAGIELAVTSRNETTQRLETLMKAAADTSDRQRWGRWLAGGFAAFLGGALLAWFIAHEPPLLAETGQSRFSVPRHDRVSTQYVYAMLTGSEEAWRAVIENFPDENPYADLARQQLARLYLLEDKDEAALEMFKLLAGETDQRLVAFGLAGQCCVLTKQGKYDQSDEIFAELFEIVPSLRDPQLQRLLQYSIRKNRDNGSGITPEKWNEWLNEQVNDGQRPDAG